MFHLCGPERVPVYQFRGGGKKSTACVGIQCCGQAQMLRRANQGNNAVWSRGGPAKVEHYPKIKRGR